MKNRSQVISKENENKHRSRLIKAIQAINLEPYENKPDGVWNCVATIKSGDVTIKSTDLDVEFDIPFDDNLEANEGEIVIYNLADSTISSLKVGAAISIEAGYNGDTGVLFNGTIQKAYSKREGADRATIIKVIDDIIKDTVNKSYNSGVTAKEILKDLLAQAAGAEGYTFEPVRDYTYDNSVTVEGDLETAIRTYAEVCGVSVFKVKGRIYAVNVNAEGTNISGEVFDLNEDTGLIGSPEHFEESATHEGYEDTYTGIEAEMLLKHDIVVTMQVELKSEMHNGTYSIKSGSHSFNKTSCVTKIKAVQKFSYTKTETEEEE